MPSALDALLLIAVGLVAGVLNVLAGGGSFLTLPMLIFLGLPPSVANGTNRVGILLQNVAAVWSFRRLGIEHRALAVWFVVPAVLGSALGAYVALWVSDRTFQKVLAFLMVGLTLASLLSKVRQRKAPEGSSPDDPTTPSPHRGLLVTGAFLAGLYGGFVQAGVGFLMLAVATWCGLDLVRGNAIKVLAILCLTAQALIIFAWQGKVDWALGLCMAIGSVIGGILGARLTVLAGSRWLGWVVTAMVMVFAVKLWWSA